MNIQKPFVLFFLAAAFGTGLFAQESSDAADAVSSGGTVRQEEAPPAEHQGPLVTGLQGEVKNNLLRLSWADSPDAKGPVYIYRSQTPFEPGAPGIGQVQKVPYGAGSYIDEIDDSGVYYYFAAASDEEGAVYNDSILPQNTFSVQIAESISAPPPVPEHKEPEERINALTARVENDRIVITFEASRDIDHLVLYRGVRPIKNAQDLLGAAIIKSDAVSPLTDYPVPGIPYYYALVSGEELSKSAVEIRPGFNATVEPVEASAGAAGKEGVRAVPLPLISLFAAMGNPAWETPEASSLSGQAVEALETIPVRKKMPAAARSGRVFPEDINVSSGGEEYLLGSIAQGPFSEKNWGEAADELTRFLSVPRSVTSEARARHYLGQCFYFNGKMREALFAFLSARSVYPDEAAEWIQAALQGLAE